MRSSDLASSGDSGTMRLEGILCRRPLGRPFVPQRRDAIGVTPSASLRLVAPATVTVLGTFARAAPSARPRANASSPPKHPITTVAWAAVAAAATDPASVPVPSYTPARRGRSAAASAENLATLRTRTETSAPRPNASFRTARPRPPPAPTTRSFNIMHATGSNE